jgi:hypothetical protein
MHDLPSGRVPPLFLRIVELGISMGADSSTAARGYAIEIPSMKRIAQNVKGSQRCCLVYSHT